MAFSFESNSEASQINGQPTAKMGFLSQRQSAQWLELGSCIPIVPGHDSARGNVPASDNKTAHQFDEHIDACKTLRKLIAN